MRFHFREALALPVDWVRESLIGSIDADVAFFKQLIVVERVAIEELALVAALKREFLVQVNQTAEQANLHARLAGEVVRVRHTALQHAADASVDKVDFLLEESKVDAQAEFCIKVSIELTFAIPAIAARTARQVHAHHLAAKVAHRDVETGFCTEVAVEQAQIDRDVAPNRCSEHHTARHFRGSVLEEQVFCLLTSVFGSLDVITIYAALRSSIEELTNLFGDRRQCAIAWQFVAEAEVGVGTHAHRYNLALEIDKNKLASLRFLRLAEIYVPLVRTVGHHLVAVRTFGNGLFVSYANVELNLQARTLGTYAFALFGVGILLLIIFLHVGLVVAALSAFGTFVLHCALESGFRVHIIAFERRCPFAYEVVDSTVERCIYRDIELEVAFCVVVLIHQFNRRVYDAAYRFHTTAEDECGKLLNLVVVSHSNLKVAAECNLVDGADAHAEDYTYGALLRLWSKRIVFIVLAVEIYAAMYVVESDWRDWQAAFAASLNIEEAP